MRRHHVSADFATCGFAVAEHPSPSRSLLTGEAPTQYLFSSPLLVSWSHKRPNFNSYYHHIPKACPGHHTHSRERLLLLGVGRGSGSSGHNKMGGQDSRFLLAFRGRVGAGLLFKTPIPMTSVGKGEICADQMIPWLPFVPYLLQ